MGKRSSRWEKEIVQLLLRELRLKVGLRQEDLAGRLKRPQSYVSKYETGQRRLDILEIREVCEALGLSLADFARRLDRKLARGKR